MNNEVLDLSFQFSIKIVKFCKHYFKLQKSFYPIFNQLLKSGTSIGANIEEATAAQSRRDFLSKMYIAFKEAKETHYWLRVISQSELISYEELHPLLNDAASLKNLLGSITNSVKTNIRVQTK